MTVKKTTRCGGYAAVIARQRLHNTNQQIDIITITKPSTQPSYNIVVGFNDKDQLQLQTKEETKHTSDDDKTKLNKDNTEPKIIKTEIIAIEDINNCVNVENYPNCENTLVFYVTKNFVKEALALRFENDQDFKRIYFTYKYFKMRNRLANNNTINYSSTENLFTKKKNYNDLFQTRKNSIEDYKSHDKVWKKSEFNVDNDMSHLSVSYKGLSRFDQPMSLIGIRSNMPDSELDSIIFTDTEQPTKPDKRRLFQRNKTKSASPPKEKVNKGEYMNTNVEKSPDLIPKDSKSSKVPDLLLFRDTKYKNKNNTNVSSNLWTASNKGVTGYESDKEDWRSSRSQFSTTAFDSLARPTKMAMALTLKKPQRLEPIPQYYRLSNEPKLALLPFRPNNYVQRPPRLPRPAPEVKRNLLNNDHRKFTSLQNLDIVPKKPNDKRQPEVKKNNYSNISHRITGLTNKLRDLGSTNTLGRFKAQSHGDVANLKPVLKHVPDSKRPVVRTCSAEPPKKVTFSAFATVQVV